MRKALLFVGVVSMLVLGPAVFAQDKPAEQSGSSQSTSGRRFSDLSPEEQAKLKAKWQNASPEERAKAREKVRERVAEGAPGPESQMRRAAIQAEITRVQEQHKTTVGELQAIKQLAIKENAKETADALTRLMTKHETQYNQQMQVLQRRMKLAQGEQEPKAGGAGQPQKSEPKKQESKSQTPGAKTK